MTPSGRKDDTILFEFRASPDATIVPVLVKKTFVHVEEIPATEQRTGRSRSLSAPPTIKSGPNADQISDDVSNAQAWSDNSSMISSPSSGREGDDRIQVSPEMERLHREGSCLPCIFFMKKAELCRLGGACTHCHLCTYAEGRRRRNRISYVKRRENRAAQRQLTQYVGK
ncbi:unnamed protein product [Durusdinium trenchii]|uniref:C3H1-type domain-containing protein n=2 Tax=Durusdinium trenchii TaxID=1381693 RepID=A0ABP0I3F6_9DINO